MPLLKKINDFIVPSRQKQAMTCLKTERFTQKAVVLTSILATISANSLQSSRFTHARFYL